MEKKCLVRPVSDINQLCQRVFGKDVHAVTPREAQEYMRTRGRYELSIDEKFALARAVSGEEWPLGYALVDEIGDPDEE